MSLATNPSMKVYQGLSCRVNPLSRLRYWQRQRREPAHGRSLVAASKCTLELHSLPIEFDVPSGYRAAV